MATPSPLSQPVAAQRNVSSKIGSTINSELTIIGDVASTGSLTLDGTIEGNVYCTSMIVTTNGRINGGIVANHEVTVQGQVTGIIRGRRVMLQSSAKVEGDIFHQGIGIEMGTRYDGTLRWTEDEHAFNEPNVPARKPEGGAHSSAT